MPSNSFPALRLLTAVLALMCSTIAVASAALPFA